MFRKLQNRLTAAANAAGFGESDVSRLTALGFSPQQAENALSACNGNVDRAAELLLAGGGAAAAAAVPQNDSHNDPMVIDLTNDDDDGDLQRALQQSMQVQQQPSATAAAARPQRTAAMHRAAEAAQRRAAAGTSYGTSNRTSNNNNKKKATTAATTTKKKSPPSSAATTHSQPMRKQQPAPSPIHITSSAILRAHHPDVKLIPKLSDKSVEERILRTADRMKSFPAAVDTLHKALTAVQNDPDSDKFRRIDTTSAGYQRSVAPATGAADFLATMGFQQQHTSTAISRTAPSPLRPRLDLFGHFRPPANPTHPRVRDGQAGIGLCQGGQSHDAEQQQQQESVGGRKTKTRRLAAAVSQRTRAGPWRAHAD